MKHPQKTHKHMKANQTATVIVNLVQNGLRSRHQCGLLFENGRPHLVLEWSETQDISAPSPGAKIALDPARLKLVSEARQGYLYNDDVVVPSDIKLDGPVSN